MLGALNHAIMRAGRDTQLRPDCPHCLMVAVSHDYAFTPQDPRNLRVWLEHYLLVDKQWRTAAMQLPVLNVWDERATKGNPKQLGAAADCKRREIARHGRLQLGDAILISALIYAVLIRWRRPCVPVACACDVTTSEKHDSIG